MFQWKKNIYFPYNISSREYNLLELSEFFENQVYFFDLLWYPDDGTFIFSCYLTQEPTYGHCG